MGENYDDKIKYLIKELNRLTKLYDEGHPEVSDKEWDNMYFELQELEHKTGIYYKDSPTQNIDYQIVNNLKKVEHDHLMLSLDKTKSIDEVKTFIGNHDYIVMAKMDGLTCSLTYDNGKLIKAETRGNGLIGEDILHNALQVKNIPTRISYLNRLVIDGEIICDYKTFDKFSNEYKNPRNFASGSIRLLDSKESAMRGLSFIAWDVIEGLNVDKLIDKLRLLQEFNFDVVSAFSDTDVNRIENFIEDIKRSCQTYGYPIDGIVVKYNKIKEYEAMGRTDHHFKGGLAYKFYDEEYETTLKNVEYTMGRTGVLTPVAIFEPIDIEGTEVSRASLHNISVLRETLGGYGWEGQKVKIFKANMIIPQISWAEPENEFTKLYFHYPMTCPICGEYTEILKENDSEILYCSNLTCEGKLLNKLDHFCSKKGLDIKGLSKATLEKLINWGWIESIKDIFTLFTHKDEWIKKQGFGIASVEKILSAIDIASETTLDKIIAAAGIPEIGSRVAKDLASHYDSWTEFRMDTDYTHIDGIGDVMNNNLLNFNYEDMDYIVAAYLDYQPKQNNNENTNILEGKIFCITGKVHIFKNRAELQADIEAKGGKCVSSMSGKVNYLINNDNTSTSAKNIAAQKAGIPILTEEEYMALG